MKKFDQNNTLTHLQYCIENHKTDTFFGVGEESAVHYGPEGGINIEAAQNLNLKLYKLNKKGGAIVAQPGDICYVHITRGESRFNGELGYFIANKLQERGGDVQVSGNDVLVEGRKVIGHMRMYLGGACNFYGGHISLTVNLPAIQRVCTKPMEKIPAGLNEFGVTREEVEEWLHEFWFRFK